MSLASDYRDHYLESYWPPRPNNPDMWRDNLELLQAYFSASKIVLDTAGPQDTLDISTGPSLAPLMATMKCIQRVQLSDFDAWNRRQIVDSDIEYWREYAVELRRLFPSENLQADELLTRLDCLRHEAPVLDVDLRRTPIFHPDVVADASCGLLTMHFVVDSICESADECFNLLGRAVRFIRPGGWLLLSALIESSGWQLGDRLQPSPNLTESQFEDFFLSNGMAVASRTRSSHKPGQVYDGRWTVFLARKRPYLDTN